MLFKKSNYGKVSSKIVFSLKKSLMIEGSFQLLRYHTPVFIKNLTSQNYDFFFVVPFKT